MTKEITALEIASEPIEGIVDNVPLTPEEEATHNQYVAEIVEFTHNIARHALEIHKRIAWIQSNRTYRVKYRTFNEFCKVELGKDNSTIFRYIKDAEFKELLLLEAADDQERASILNLREGNSRYLRTLPPDVQTAMWKCAYAVGRAAGLPVKDDGSLEVTTGYLESVGAQMDTILRDGVINLDGEAIDLDQAEHVAQASGVDEETVKTVLLAAGVSEEYFERLQRQSQHIREKSIRADFISERGTVEIKVDLHGSEYPVLVDSKGNEIDLGSLFMSFNQRFVHVSLKSPIRE